MKTFFGNDILLNTPASQSLYEKVKDLPIIDYHCHLDDKAIAEDKTFDCLGELWLGGDHYKWRAMRLCGVDEEYITGGKSYHEKFLAYAKIFPKLCGSPLYYWTQLELKEIFGITLPLNEENAEEIEQKANEILKTLSVRKLLKKMKVEYIATTDDPVSDLNYHGTYDGITIAPTFRPDRILSLDEGALAELSACTGVELNHISDVKKALEMRLDYFVTKGCKISDHGIDDMPVKDVGEEIADLIYCDRVTITPMEREQIRSHLLAHLAGLYRERNIMMQWHVGPYRNVNEAMFRRVGKDAGFDIMHDEIHVDRLTAFFNELNKKNALPVCILYSLNPVCIPALATMSGAFKNVYIGPAWWFCDTLHGIEKQLENVAEYAVLGTNPGMLTDSRSFASYVRFDFFRRILCNFVGDYVEKGEYDAGSAEKLVTDVCYHNIKTLLGGKNA